MSALVKELVEAGVHYGHRASRWNPKMRPYIYARQNLIHIIDVKATVKGLLLARRFLTKTVANGKTVDPGKFNWDKVDIRTVAIVQDPGPSNPLGQIKFLFPNKHDVYLHDTPSKALFNADMRAFSHGCIRVGDAIGFATALLGGTRSRETIDRIIASGNTTTISLPERLPVYVTYFTATVDADGAVVFKRDIYGRDAGRAKTSDCRKQGCSA